MKKFGKDYCGQIIKNAKNLAKELSDLGFDVLGENKGFTNTHQILVDVRNAGGGDMIAKLCEDTNIILNKNVLLGDVVDVKNPNGLRIGVQEMTRFGMKEKEMKEIAKLMKRLILDKESPEKIRKEVIKFRRSFQKVGYC